MTGTPDHRLIDGRAVQRRILEDLHAPFARERALRPVGRLVSVSIGPSSEVEVHGRNQARDAARAGLPFDQQVWPADMTRDEAKRRITALNDDPTVPGGVGPVTVAMLMRNALAAHRRQVASGWLGGEAPVQP